MKRRYLLLSLPLLVVAWPGAALAEPVDDIIAQLRDEGYSEIEATQTLLGRTRIMAAGGTMRRELIVNPRTGEILRDIWVSDDDDNFESGDRDDEDDDDDNDDDDDGDDDDDDD
jgi:hypothetical protein